MIILTVWITIKAVFFKILEVRDHAIIKWRKLHFLNTHFRVQILWVSDLSPGHAFWFSFRGHLWSTTEIMDGRGSFQVHFGDHLQSWIIYSTVKYAHFWHIERRQKNAVKSERTTFWHHCRGHLKSSTNVAGSSF